MRHLGDITKISGHTAPIVDCVIGGSPCQDLSVAGRRAGLDGERSGLFMEQIRIVKEMRSEDERNGRTGVDIRPRYMVWENVPGAFSSNKGEDFRTVLEEIAKVTDEDAVIPLPDKGKWTNYGCIVGDGWSIAWRVLDAQFWGVPQRRRRIALVADFGGQSAPEILFVRKSLSGHTDEGKPKGKKPTTDASRGIGADDRLGADQYNAVILGDTVSTLGVNCGMSHGRQCILEPLTPVTCYDIGEARLRTPSEYKGLSPTLSARCGTGGNNTPAVITFEPGIASREGGHVYEGVCGTLRANAGDNQMATAYTMQDREGCAGGGKGALIQKDRSAALRTVNSQYPFQPVKTFSKSKRVQSDKDFETWHESDTANTLNAFDIGDVRTTEAVVYVVDQGGGKSACNVTEGQAPTLTCTHGGEPVIALDRASFNQGKNAQFDFEVSDKGVNSPLVAKGPGAVCYPTFIDVELEVAVRKYEVKKELLQECLRDHKGNFTNKEIALELGKPLTLVEHWFRRDSSFAIPDPDIWFKLKELLGIETTEFDQAIMEFEVKGGNYDMRNRIHISEIAPTLACGCGNDLYMLPQDVVAPLQARDYKGGKLIALNLCGEDKVGTLMARDFKGVDSSDTFDRVVCQAVDCRNGTEDAVNGALQSNSAHSLNGNNVVRTRYIVRRLTPLECERLQGYPDGWTDIGEYIDSTGKTRKTSDAARYKALGNSIALPPWKWVLKRICACYERDATMASLFDGIGGFPYLWEQLNGKGSCLWASEIEEFPMAVTKVRIGE